MALARAAAAEIIAGVRVVVDRATRPGRENPNRRGRHRGADCHRRRRPLDAAAAARVAIAASCHPRGHGLVHAARGRAVRARPLPVFILESRHGMHYGFPVSPAGTGQDRQASSPRRDGLPDDPRRPVSAIDESLIRAALGEPHPGGERPPRRRQDLPLHDDAGPRLHHRPPCLAHRTIIIASPCSGHGFKFAPVIGEILADSRRRRHQPRHQRGFGSARFGGGTSVRRPQSHRSDGGPARRRFVGPAVGTMVLGFSLTGDQS